MRINSGWKQVLLLILPCVAMASVVSGESESIAVENNREQIESVRIYLVDEVKGDCWNNTAEVRNTAELVFRQHGIEVTGSPLGFFGNYPDFRKIVINGVGYRTTSGKCFASLSITSSLAVMQSSSSSQESGFETFAEEKIGTYLLSDAPNLNNLFNESIRASLTNFLGGR